MVSVPIPTHPPRSQLLSVYWSAHRHSQVGANRVSCCIAAKECGHIDVSLVPHHCRPYDSLVCDYYVITPGR